MIANILIAGSFFTLGFLLGGAYVIGYYMRHGKEIPTKTPNSEPVTIKIYESKEK